MSGWYRVLSAGSTGWRVGCAPRTRDLDPDNQLPLYSEPANRKEECLNHKVQLDRRDVIGIVTVNSPPVNALGAAVRGGIFECMKKAIADPEIKAIVLTCAGRTFIAGADITEFDKPPRPPDLDEVLTAIENSPKPIIAAIHGTALGGGLEVALACHYRVATKDARLGLPEVKLGLLPGAGGTQRLPRAVGPELAVKMIVGGDPIGASHALKNGLIEEIVEGPASGGEAFARKVLAERRLLRKLRDDDSKLATAKADRSIFANAVAALTKKARGLEAPFAAADAVGAAIDLPFDEGLRKERESFLKLVSSDQSKAQRYAFFSEREAAKVEGVPDGTKPRNIERVAVIGAGTMGGGIAMSFANAGIPVTLIETGEEQLKRGMGVIQKNYEATAARGGIPADAASKRMGLINGVVGIENVKDADLVIEAVFETMAIKKEVFEKLDKFAKPGAVLASNTSYLNIDEIAKSTKRPRDVLGMHFFSPANVMKLCEIVRADKTAPDALMTAVAVARKIAKVPAVVGVCDGFVGNRMLAQRIKESEKLLFEGALPQQVDAVVTKFGMPMGPFAMADLAGLDIGWRSRKDRGIKSEIEDALCEAGRFGQKTGKGYYKYEGGSRAPLPDPEVEKLIDETLQRLGKKRRAISDEEILERMMYPMINEGARILEEGIAARPSDIDVIWLYGYGWPIYRGGPMFYADQIGLKHIADRLANYSKVTSNPSLEPAPLLKRLVAEGVSFGSLTRPAKEI
jgi:3-hydroxyacyl-CoA dehydrogenase